MEINIKLPKFLQGKIEKFTFSEPSKRELFTKFRLCFGKVVTFFIPHADWIRHDFHAMQMIVSGNDYKFWSPRTSAGHSDGCCAAALCKRAAGFGDSPAISATAQIKQGITDGRAGLNSGSFM